MASLPDHNYAGTPKVRLESAEAREKKKRRICSPPTSRDPRSGKGITRSPRPLSAPSGTPLGRSEGAARASQDQGGSDIVSVGSGSSARPSVRTYVGNEGNILKVPRKEFVDLTPSKLQQFTPVGEKPSENAVQCDTCAKWTRSFKFMSSVKVVENTEVFLGDLPDKQIYTRTCAPCIAKETGESLASAITNICQQRVRLDRGRCLKYQNARTKIEQNFTFVASITGNNRSKRFSRAWPAQTSSRSLLRGPALSHSRMSTWMRPSTWSKIWKN